MAEKQDVVIIGAGAAGMMCAIEAGKRGRRVLVLDHAKAPGEKIRISGGGRCNFTNIDASPRNFLSGNPHFCKSALARYRPQDFVALVERHGISWHEKTLGQLFCDHSAKDIIRMLTAEMSEAGVQLALETAISAVERIASGFRITTSAGSVDAASLVLASGGKSIPKMGATGFAYRIAEQFDMPLVETRPALVPLTLDQAQLAKLGGLAGVAADAEARFGKEAFREAVLITHRGLSGPAILQISSYWREGEEIVLRLMPDIDIASILKGMRRTNGRQAAQTALADILPRRLAQFFADEAKVTGRMLADLSDKAIDALSNSIQAWAIKPAGSEGYRTAEVTLGGVDTRALDSRSMQAREVPGLYFIGECVDVTGWLGGYNFQWAWSSGFVAGQDV
ncbi:NAD(P)/FAD-dependent oxidoreductase [Sinorhizobium medicae]|uniref:Putative oxidoreductase with FAD/NAD(P)-binding domain n=1 Tax=Sinorhizobium medicae TaxID=110321 RepID=A0A508X0H9_9HYPH|nr:NAD(P)/FAD-dependent oxidoreductase [Sinorhizobium medicae]MDX0422337.1 aminoacetone oxidase family FAD-binding enzyme [Sinorhizobium medicae]MDX0519902.1 aminoacetone oxidase family FAD-binding enzyme [Sinorhizobium medicae]MDX0544702.1 aminoacetone oxidase family FAD-binding enzyme [Sinorhizobium medicae]MDX0631639.1 aminoacetone oxidase family FAD-binding enzyme [Sinorhizobium medicae]MDX0711231.1 aminoacetone oxidase family FAD-binding enzyme [Sinorhizobium medicae]